LGYRLGTRLKKRESESKRILALITMTLAAIIIWLLFQEEWRINISFFTHTFSAFVLAKWVELGSRSFGLSTRKEIFLKYLIFFVFGAFLWEALESYYFSSAYKFFSWEITNDTRDGFFDVMYGLLGTTLSLINRNNKKRMQTI